MAELEEEEEETGCFRDQTAAKKGRICITYLWSNVHDHLTELFIIHRESLILLFQGHELPKLGAWY